MKFLCAIIAIFASALGPVDAAAPGAFPVSPHDNVTIEWWYLNAHFTTAKGRHMAMICSFFRFGNGSGQLAMDSSIKMSRCHYLIWALADEDSKTRQSYSLGDQNTLDMLQQYAGYRLLMNPGDARAANLLDIVSRGQFPEPTKLLSGASQVTDNPFVAQFGPDDSVRSEEAPGKTNAFELRLASPDSPATRLDLHFDSSRPPMYVGGDGNTGLRRPDDMKYVSLTRCRVSGNVSDASGSDPVASGQGWFDHQWGDTWTTQTTGWDWWGVQLADGTDILLFRQRDLATGKIFFPLATFMDPSGKLRVTRNIVFTPASDSLWTSPRTGISYPLRWTLEFPDNNITLQISPAIEDQEMAVISGSDSIWEGDCSVSAKEANGAAVGGVAYMELVGYNSPAVKNTLAGKGHSTLPN